MNAETIITAIYELWAKEQGKTIQIVITKKPPIRDEDSERR